MKYFEVLFFKLLFGSYQTKIRESTRKITIHQKSGKNCFHPKNEEKNCLTKTFVFAGTCKLFKSKSLKTKQTFERVNVVIFGRCIKNLCFTWSCTEFIQQLSTAYWNWTHEPFSSIDHVLYFHGERVIFDNVESNNTHTILYMETQTNLVPLTQNKAAKRCRGIKTKHIYV